VTGVRLAPDGTLRIGDAGVRLTPEQALAASLQANAVLRLVPRPPRPVVTATAGGQPNGRPPRDWVPADRPDWLR
jgi:hypothetical protein